VEEETKFAPHGSAGVVVAACTDKIRRATREVCLGAEGAQNGLVALATANPRGPASAGADGGWARSTWDVS
jgi:hypothetical protein